MAITAKKVVNAEVRSAKRFLARRKLSPNEISPVLFAKAAKEANISFNELLIRLAQEEGAGQT